LALSDSCLCQVSVVHPRQTLRPTLMPPADT